MKFSVRKEAEADISEAYKYYELCGDSLGVEFIQCVEATFAHVRKNPNQYRKIYLNVHRALVNRFPYGVYYVVIEDSISVIGVVHARKNPEHWQART